MLNGYPPEYALLLFLRGATVLRIEENNLLNCSLNHSPIGFLSMQSISFELSFRVFYNLETCFFSLEFFMSFRIQFSLIENRFAIYKWGSLSFVEAGFKTEVLHT